MTVKRNPFRDILSLSVSNDDYPTETTSISVQSADGAYEETSVHLAFERPGGELVSYAYLTDDEVSELIDALTFYRDRK